MDDVEVRIQKKVSERFIIVWVVKVGANFGGPIVNVVLNDPESIVCGLDERVGGRVGLDHRVENGYVMAKFPQFVG